MVRHPFPVSVGPSPFLDLGWFMVTGWWPLLRLLVLDSSDARSHLHDALASASTPISGRWIVQAPAFLGLCLGFFLLVSHVGCCLAVLAVSLSCPPSVASLRWVTLVLCRVLVGLPSWSCCSSGLRDSVVFLVYRLGHLSLVRSVFFLSPRSWRGFPYFGWVCFWSSCGSAATG